MPIGNGPEGDTCPVFSFEKCKFQSFAFIDPAREFLGAGCHIVQEFQKFGAAFVLR